MTSAEKAAKFDGVFPITEILQKVGHKRWNARIKDRIARVGIELEGGWLKLPTGVTLVHDGSVQIKPPLNEGGTSYLSLHTGELPSDPMEVGKIPAFLEQNYPSHVNASCGMHVHMSLKHALHYSSLMVPEFSKTMLHFLKVWAQKEGTFNSKHHIWERLSGKNDYCKDEFFADAQAFTTSKGHTRGVPGSRYTTINFCHNVHGTMECRVLPMMDDWKQAQRAIQEVLDITNACLVVGAERQERVEAGFKIGRETDAITSEKRVVLPGPGVESEQSATI